MSYAQKDLEKLVEFVERGGRTKRCHTLPTIVQQTVADHSFGVAWWLHVLCDGMPSAELLMAALAHDIAEHVTGDIPSPAKDLLLIKKHVGTIEDELTEAVGIKKPKLNKHEQRLLNLADSLELMQYCVREQAMGNNSSQLHEMFINVLNYANSIALMQNEQAAIDLVTSKWRGKLDDISQ